MINNEERRISDASYIQFAFARKPFHSKAWNDHFMTWNNHSKPWNHHFKPWNDKTYEQMEKGIASI